jgi:hypothetical protein
MKLILILIAYNQTKSEGTFFTLPKEGFFTVGRGTDNLCVPKNLNPSYTIQSDFDKPIKFGQTGVYSCIVSLNSDELASFCNGKKWKDLVLFNFPNLIQYVGTFGNANYQYIKDWTPVIVDYNIDNSTWYAGNKTCYMPGQIFFDVLTSTAGAISNPQQYIVASRISANYYNITHSQETATNQQNFTLSFLTNYVPLTTNMFTQTRDNPSIIPGIPKDIAAPLIQGN